jgi:purine-nucleoside phosphorylase
MYVVSQRFIVNRGLPGAGGVSTQAAELAALGVKQIIHIGTAGFIGEALPDRAIVASDGSYKDGGAVMLSDRPDEPIAIPDATLTSRIHVAAKHLHIDVRRATGYTSPIFYYQPSGLIRDLIGGPRFAQQRPGYVEMEQAPLFETAHRANVAAASIVIGSDRYRLEKGELKHDYFDSTTQQELDAMRIAIEALSGAQPR